MIKQLAKEFWDDLCFRRYIPLSLWAWASLLSFSLATAGIIRHIIR